MTPWAALAVSAFLVGMDRSSGRRLSVGDKGFLALTEGLNIGDKASGESRGC
jgi:hypothetical protein